MYVYYWSLGHCRQSTGGKLLKKGFYNLGHCLDTYVTDAQLEVAVFV